MPLNVVAVQLDIRWEDRPANRDRVADLLRGQTRPGSLIVLPEMFDAGFTMRADKAVDDDGTTDLFLGQLAREHASYVLAGHASRDGSGRPINQLGVYAPTGERLHQYIKTYPFSIAGEDKSYTAGPGASVIDIAGLKVAPAICYDLRFPELFRAGRALGAEVFVVIANWPVARVEHWLTLARARAIENQAWVIAVNRTGTDPTPLTYPGRSVVIDPQGTIVADAGATEGLLRATIDEQAVRSWREKFPVWRDVK
jgi:predicted amidohydrolase